MMKRLFPAMTVLGLTLDAALGWASFRPGRIRSHREVGPGAVALTRTDPHHTYALLLNGGGRREINYHSHLVHLQQAVALLHETSIDPAHVTIFSGDGSDPAPDLATREVVQDPELWLLPRGGGSLRPEIGYMNSTIDGFTLEPARKDVIRNWFETTGKKLGKGDTLFFYVIDHGEKNAKDMTNNSITLWNESLGVGELREIVGKLDPGVRVVEMMSQCFSGAFARTIYPNAALADAA